MARGAAGVLGVDPATGMTVHEYRFLASRGLPPRDAAGQPLLGPNANVMTRMRVHSPDPTAPPGSTSRSKWTLSIEQGNLRMRGDGGWFDTRYGRAADGTEIDVRPYRRGPDGAWIESATGRPVADANVRAALDQWDANMAASHIPLFPGEGGAPTPPPRPPETPPSEGPPGAPPRAGAGGAELEPGVRPPGTVEAAAAAIPGSTFTGDAAKKAGIPGPNRRDVDTAMNRLAAPDGLFASQKATVVETPDAALALRLDVRNGDRVTVRIELGTVPPDESGGIPVATFKRVGDTNEYVVTVSRDARPDSVERGLAHELGEINAAHQKVPESTVAAEAAPKPTDALSPTSRGKITELSPHDEGRLTELKVLGRQLAETPADTPEYRRILNEAQLVAAERGLIGEGEGVAQRQKLAREALGEGFGRAILDNAIKTASDNPFLQRQTGDVAEDLRLLQRRLEHARSLGEPAGKVQPFEPFKRQTTKWTARESEIIENIRQLLLREEIVSPKTEEKRRGEVIESTGRRSLEGAPRTEHQNALAGVHEARRRGHLAGDTHAEDRARSRSRGDRSPHGRGRARAVRRPRAFPGLARLPRQVRR